MRFTLVSLLSLTTMAGLCLLVAGCSKTGDSSSNPSGITARIDGKPFHAFQAAGGLYANYYQVGGVGTLNGDTVFLTVYVATPVTLNQKVSTDDNGFAEIDYVIHRNNVPYASYSAFQGQKGPAYYTVTAIDTVKHTIAGTFSGTLGENGAAADIPDSVVLTNGEFDNTYQQ
jgi:hypothetical protein